MRYILKYKDKEDFLEDNPKEEIKLPIVWEYPKEKCRTSYRGSVQYDSNTGEVTNYEEPVLVETMYAHEFREDGKNDMFTFITRDNGEETVPPFFP